jgi:dTDP-glucose pyrophosphorylase
MTKIRIGVIPAAGKGNRLTELPFTRILPKPMLPLLNKPILEYIIENMKKVGVETIYLIVGHKGELIRDYFGDGKDWDLDILYIEQRELKGIAHAISLAQDYINEPFIVILGDDLTLSTLENVVNTFTENRAWVVEGVVVENDTEALRRSCCVTLKDGTSRIEDIIEKPTDAKSNLRGIGVYIFDPIVFSFIEKTSPSFKRSEKEITDTIGLIAKGGRAYGVLMDGPNININTLADLIRANRVLLDRRE